jgi:hypothetical protein
METVNGKQFTSPSQAAFEKQNTPVEQTVPASQQVRVEPKPEITKEQAQKLAAELTGKTEVKAAAVDPKATLASIYSHLKGNK